MSSASSDEEAAAAACPIEISDEEVYRRKLLMDGEGQGDCRRIDALMKEFFQWDEAKDLTPEQVDEGHEKLLALLSNIELAAKKSVEAQRTNDRQIEEYDAAYADIEAKIEDTKKTIAEKKVELVEAKKVRKNKLKYHALGNIIAKLPDRKQTQDRLVQLGAEISDLKARNEILESEMQKKGKKLELVLNAVKDLKIELRNKEKEEWEESDSD